MGKCGLIQVLMEIQLEGLARESDIERGKLNVY